MTTLTSDNLISEITDELSGLPYAQRVAAVRAYQRMLSKPLALRLKYALPHHSPDRADALVHAVTHLILNRNPITFW